MILANIINGTQALQWHLVGYYLNLSEALNKDARVDVVLQAILVVLVVLVAVPFVFRQLRWAVGFMLQALLCLGLLGLANHYSEGRVLEAVRSLLQPPQAQEDVHQRYLRELQEHKDGQSRFLRDNDGGVVNSAVMGFAGMVMGALFGRRNA